MISLRSSAFLITVLCLSPFNALAQNGSIDLAGETDAAPTVLPALPALPSDTDPAFTAPFAGEISASEMLGLTFFSALMLFVLVLGWGLIREKRRNRENLLAANAAIQTLQSRLDQSESLLNASDQLMIIWNSKENTPSISGGLATKDHYLPEGAGILAFGSWLQADCAQQVEQSIDQLRSLGQRFVLTAETLGGVYIELKGRTSGARALLQLRALEGEDFDRARLDHEAKRQAGELTRLRNLLDAAPMPIWSRDDEGNLSWVNHAYMTAVESESLDAVVGSQTELLDQRGRQAVSKAHAQQQTEIVSENRLPVIVAGKRQIFDVVDIASEQGSVGIATDVSRIETVEKAMDRMQAFHTNTMEQLTTPVAIFDSSQQLQHYNAAYSTQFNLDAAFLDTHPSDSSVLDKMRTNRSLPEQADFHSWKADFLVSYREVEPREYWWHLPNGQSLRVVATPNPDGGVTYIYENVTEQLELEKRYNALFRMQQETLDHLNDGVVVFSSGGRVLVSNPAFAKLWDFPAEQLNEQPHIGVVLEWCRRKFTDETVWSQLKGSVVGLNDKREGLHGRMECSDGRYLDFASIPLPDGGTMVTFVDVTDNVIVERGLNERNEALLAADHLKNTFIQHVSYELRSPLTNIIGFTELLTDQTFGELNDRQKEYLDHITTSGSSLLAIVNDILDLATIDAGIMGLELEQVDPLESIRAAAEGLQDRLADKDISLDISVPENHGAFVGDKKRVRQVLFNLISNAIAFSDVNSEITVIADHSPETVSFTVRDQGCGIPENYHTTAFDRFESRKAGANRRGAGLGLSIVKSFVELHGGSVTIESEEGIGTQVTCSFPVEPKELNQPETEAAE